MASAPVNVVLTVNAVGSPPTHKFWLAEGVAIVGQAKVVHIEEAEMKQVFDPPTGVNVIVTFSPEANPEIV